jgi:hypothetical protein
MRLTTKELTMTPALAFAIGVAVGVIAARYALPELVYRANRNRLLHGGRVRARQLRIAHMAITHWTSQAQTYTTLNRTRRAARATDAAEAWKAYYSAVVATQGNHWIRWWWAITVLPIDTDQLQAMKKARQTADRHAAQKRAPARPTHRTAPSLTGS